MAGRGTSLPAPSSVRTPLSHCRAAADTSAKPVMAEGGGDRKFPAFPFEPYSIQIDFMNALYSSLDRGGISMLESPTGTGKTLSIICSALQWLADQKEKQNSLPGNPDENGSSADQHNSDDEPDWMRNFVVTKNTQVDDDKPKKKKYGVAIGKPEKRKNGESRKNLSSKGAEVERLPAVETKNLEKNDAGDVLDDKEFLLEEYQSEEEGNAGVGKWKRKVNGVSVSSSSDEDEDHSDNDDDQGRPKVYFCSRTHSQLSQFVKELKKTSFANDLRVVCLGSRKNFCINEDVLKLGSSNRINERCLELQTKKKTEGSKVKNLCTGGRARRMKAASGCPMLRKHKLQRQFKDQLSQQGALDIEDLVHLGHSIGTCPYYGSRSMVPIADLVVLPYQSLLSKSSRESLGLNLKKNVIIIDEAHNLADSLISMYDAKITSSQLEDVYFHLEKYLERFHNLLGHGNRRYIQTLLVISQGFLRTLNEDCIYSANCQEDQEKSSNTKIMNDSSLAINDFLFALNIDNINFLKLVDYIKESNIIHKVSGYGSKLSTQSDSAFNNNQTASEDRSTLSSFRALADMLLSLTYKNGDGRIIISRARTTPSGQIGGYIKYVMLTGEKIFAEIADEAHAVILAGGTLQPVEETRGRLFPWLPVEQLKFFSCNHIVPRESILPIAVSRGPTGRVLDFSYSSRSSPTMIEELGLLICNLVSVIPEGIVVFFSSFDYEDQVYSKWNALGILERIKKKKRVFREPRKNTEVDLVLKEYRETIDASSTGNPKEATHNGAVFLAVVGGKVSEGINFSDGMGRCIVMVGLPYPNPSDIELMERIKHIDGLGESNPSFPKFSALDENSSTDAQAGFQVLRSCGHKGKAYYENLCMKAVNQSIGRAIRHIGDYAAILLVDKRYASDPSKKSHHHQTDKLPKWIKDSLIPSTNSYGEVHRLLHQFFKFNKK